MPAKKGNDWWKLRAKHGTKKAFATPDEMWNAACEYFQHCVDNPIYNPIINKYIPQPFTMGRLCLFLGLSSSYFRQFKIERKAANTETDKDFLTIVDAIESVVFSQVYEGAMIGIYKENLAARSLGLADKTDNTHSGEMTVKIPEIKVYDGAPPMAGSEDEVKE